MQLNENMTVGHVGVLYKFSIVGMSNNGQVNEN